MGTRARVCLLLGATSCLLAVMFDWILSLGNDRQAAHVAPAITAPPAPVPADGSAIDTPYTT